MSDWNNQFGCYLNLRLQMISSSCSFLYWERKISNGWGRNRFLSSWINVRTYLRVSIDKSTYNQMHPAHYERISMFLSALAINLTNISRIELLSKGRIFKRWENISISDNSQLYTHRSSFLDLSRSFIKLKRSPSARSHNQWRLHEHRTQWTIHSLCPILIQEQFLNARGVDPWSPKLQLGVVGRRRKFAGLSPMMWTMSVSVDVVLSARNLGHVSA